MHGCLPGSHIARATFDDFIMDFKHQILCQADQSVMLTMIIGCLDLSAHRNHQWKSLQCPNPCHQEYAGYLLWHVVLCTINTFPMVRLSMLISTVIYNHTPLLLTAFPSTRYSRNAGSIVCRSVTALKRIYFVVVFYRRSGTL